MNYTLRRDEFTWIRRIQTTFAAVGAFAQDQAWVDAVVLGGRNLRASVDAAIAGRHFPWPTPHAHACGYRAIAAALSDLAVVAAHRDIRMLLDVVLPASLAPAEVAAIDAVLAGAAACLAEFGGTLLGGNITQGEQLALHSTVIAAGAPPRAGRGPVQPGDLLWLTGTHGDAAGGLYVQGHGREVERLRTAFWHPRLRWDWGRRLWRRAWVVAATDVSDGWARDLWSLALPQHLGVALNPTAVPRSQEWRQICAQQPQVHTASYWGGDDYELAFATRGISADAAAAALRRAGIAATCVGHVQTRRGIHWLAPPEVEPPPGFGYDPYL